MPWWAWIALGVVFLVAEVIISADFYLVFFGVSGLIVGLVMLVGLDLPMWAQWLIFSAIAIVALSLYRGRFKAKLTTPDRDLTPDVIGETGIVADNMAAGGVGRVELRGSVWQARNDGELDLVAGDRVSVLTAEGIVLHVQKTD